MMSTQCTVYRWAFAALFIAILLEVMRAGDEPFNAMMAAMMFTLSATNGVNANLYKSVLELEEKIDKLRGKVDGANASS